MISIPAAPPKLKGSRANPAILNALFTSDRIKCVTGSGGFRLLCSSDIEFLQFVNHVSGESLNLFSFGTVAYESQSSHCVFECLSKLTIFDDVFLSRLPYIVSSSLDPLDAIIWITGKLGTARRQVIQRSP